MNAEQFATAAHGSQKYGSQPYVCHLQHVILILKQEGYDNNPILADACWLHDVAEDTQTSLDEIEKHFGFEVRDIVYRVTDEPGQNREERKLKTYPKIKGHQNATIVKLCDRIANVEASKNNPQKFIMYKNEYSKFKQHLFVSGLADNLWQRLDILLA